MTYESAFIERLATLSNSGEPFVAVTLARATGSTPQDAGSKMLVTAAGLHCGTVGGGKVEAKAIALAQEMLDGGHSIQLVEWNLKRDVGMTCGGSVSLLFETYNLGVWKIVIFGAGHVAQALTKLLATLRCHVTVVDSRQEWLDRIPESPQIRRCLLADPAQFVSEIDHDTFVLCMTMGHATDRPILEAILKSGKSLPYLGVIGSRAKRAVLTKELLAAGIEQTKIDSIICPIGLLVGGLPIGTNHPGEIAVSIVAQLLEVRDH
jgi:xanthine dehydrogenase accessory factor